MNMPSNAKARLVPSHRTCSRLFSIPVLRPCDWAAFPALRRTSCPIRTRRRQIRNRTVQDFPSPIQILRRSIRNRSRFQ
jgi:hypothetical protein